MNRKMKFALILAGVAIAIPQGAFAKAPVAKLWNGTWHLNTAKSKFASPAKEQSETRTYQISGNRITMKSSSKDRSGKLLNFSYSARYDGKWYPMVGNPRADSISLIPVNERELKSRSRLQGKVSAESIASISADGKHLTVKRKMVRMKDAPTDILEFDR